MAALATVDDIPGADAFTQQQRDQAQAALDTASAVIRAYCRRQFDQQQFTTRLRARGNWIVLPQRPVVSVESVAVLVYGVPTTTSGWLWDGLDRIWIGNLGMIINLAEELFDAIMAGVTVADVAYTAGYASVPDDVVAVAVGMAQRALAIPAGGVFSAQAAGPFSVTVAPWAQGGPMSLTDGEKAILGQYRRATATVELRS